jgi:hypothetical protein
MTSMQSFASSNDLRTSSTSPRRAGYDRGARDKIELEHLHFLLSMAFIEVQQQPSAVKSTFCRLLRACRFNGNFGG